MVTKESILANHSELTDRPLYGGFTQLAFIKQRNQHGLSLALTRADRLTYVSPMWFLVGPKYNANKVITDAIITGVDNLGNNSVINKPFIKAIRKRNPAIKIVPHFHFKGYWLWKDEFTVNENLVQRVAQTLATFCRKHQFDGLVVEFEGIGKDFTFMDSKVYTIETLKQIGNVIGNNNLVAILSSPAPCLRVEENCGPEKRASLTLLSKNECSDVLTAWDHLHIWTYIDSSRTERKYINDEYIEANAWHCDYTPKMFVTMSHFGIEFPLDKYRKQYNVRDAKRINAERFLDVLKEKDSVLEFNQEHKEHELTFERNNTFIIFPSLTSLEYRIVHALALKLGISYWDYGDGLDYFTNLV